MNPITVHLLLHSGHDSIGSSKLLAVKRRGREKKKKGKAWPTSRARTGSRGNKRSSSHMCMTISTSNPPPSILELEDASWFGFFFPCNFRFICLFLAALSFSNVISTSLCNHTEACFIFLSFLRVISSCRYTAQRVSQAFTLLLAWCIFNSLDFIMKSSAALLPFNIFQVFVQAHDAYFFLRRITVLLATHFFRMHTR